MRYSSQIRRLRQGHIHRWPPKKDSACFFNTKDGAAVRRVIQVCFKNLVFTHDSRELHRNNPLLDLAGDGFVFGEQRIFHHLLSDSRCSLTVLPCGEVGENRTNNGSGLYAVVVIKIGILDRDRSLLNERRYLCKSNRGSLCVLTRIIEENLACSIVDFGGFGSLPILE